jgi:hypothetical protein
MTKLTAKTRHKQQTNTSRASWNKIMAHPGFSDGMKDAGLGIFNPDKREWCVDVTSQWAYERGWGFARRVGRSELRWARKGVVSKDDQIAAARLYAAKAFL